MSRAAFCLLLALPSIAAAQTTPRLDRFGDPLPPGAVKRLGTVRLRAGAPVERLAFSPDGKRLATARHDGKVILWDSATGKEVRVLVHPANDIWALAFSHDGKSLATVSTQERRQLLRLWDLSRGREIEHFRKVDNAALAELVFSPDGRLLAGAFAADKLTLWKLAGWKEVHTFRSPGRYFTNVAFSHDGRLLAAISSKEDEPDQIVYVWETTTGRELRQIEIGSPGISALAFVPRSRLVAMLRDDGRVSHWDVDTGAERKMARVGGERLWTCALSADAGTVAVASGRAWIHVCDPSSGKQLQRLSAAHFNAPFSLTLSPDGRTLAAHGESGVIHLWDVSTGKELLPSSGHTGAVKQVVYLDAGKVVSAGADDTVRLWDVASGRELRRLPGGILSPDGKTLAVVEAKKKVRLLETATGKSICLFQEHGGKVDDVAFSADGWMAASLDRDGMVYLWQRRTGKVLRRLDASRPGRLVGDPGTMLSFSADGKVLLLQGPRPVQFPQTAFSLWDVETGRLLQSKAPAYGRFWTCPDSRLFARIDLDVEAEREQISLCNTVTGHCVRLLPWGEQAPADILNRDVWRRLPLAFSGNGRLMTSLAGKDNALRLFDTASGRLVQRLEGHRGKISDARFSIDSRTLATASRDHTIRLWEVATGKERRRLEGHRGGIDTFSFSPDERTFASAGYDSTILVWDLTGLPPGKPDLSPALLQATWDDLASPDAPQAYRAVWMLANTAEQSVPFLGRHLDPVPAPNADRLKQLVADLDSDDFATRQKASAELQRLGELAEPFLHKALAEQPAPETRRRIERLLAAINPYALTVEQLRGVRAVEALERADTRESTRLLERLARGANGARLTREAGASLERLRKRSSD